MRKRTIFVPQIGTGKKCPPLADVRSCNGQACEAKCKAEDWSGWGKCSEPCGWGQKVRSRNVAGGFGSDMGQTCGFSTDAVICHIKTCAIHKKKMIEKYAIGCPPLDQTIRCNMHKCPIPCGEGPWTEWKCTVTCGQGTRSRKRSLTPPKHGGKKCGRAIESETYNCGPPCTFPPSPVPSPPPTREPTEVPSPSPTQ